MKKLIQFPEKCIGCGYCVDIDSFQWEMDNEGGKAILKDARKHKNYFFVEIFEEDIKIHGAVIEACPTNCIILQ